ncbi:hypothetical protein [Sphingopyxis sp. JAI128]|uniref:hypothetical protein n=1 Tax=Sphingopyxis sp. JAI128 TaxID=2723066 RepID=UPI001611FCB9|nr:hypothetical protein [Sphingopyxis sp. JAI128]MBB6427421.1 hypothetical protein [Sphingopyxis sp. JAI128]
MSGYLLVSDFDRWRDSVELNCCFLDFADPYELGKFKIAKDIGTIEAIKFLMISDIFARIEHGELLAYGFRTLPHVSDGPVVIPIHCFAQRPEMVDIEKDIIIASGWRYERVRVGAGTCEDVPAATISTGTVKTVGKAGRPDTYPAARVALLALSKRDPTSIRQPANRLINHFNVEYLQHVGTFGLQIARLSERTLREHLKRFRQELAEMGKYNSSN